MQALTVDMLENFRVDGMPKDMADTTKQIVVSKLRCFLRDALRRGRIKEPLAERVKGHEAEHEEKKDNPAIPMQWLKKEWNYRGRLKRLI